MYCGSCLRDNALAAELLARGHDVTIVPLYTPLRTDEPNVTRSEVLFGGISVYLQQYSSIFRKTPRFVDRILDSPGLIRTFADRSVSTDPRLLGELTISMLEGTGGVLRKEFDKLLEWVRAEPVPDVVSITNSMLIAFARPLADALRRPIVVTLQGEDLFLMRLADQYRDRALDLLRRHVKDVHHFIAVSDYYRRFMTTFIGIPEDKISVVPLGISLTGYRPPDRQDDGVFRIGYFARLAPEKGLHVLADAFLRLRARASAGGGPAAAKGVRLDAAGYVAAADKPYLAEIETTIARAGAAADFKYHGSVDRDGKLAFLRSLDVLSMPATYDEPKGFPLLEAMASGVPVVQPRRGSFTEIVESTGGGLLVAPDDPESLAEGLLRLWNDPALRRQLGERAYHGVRAHYTVQKSVDRLLEVLGRVA
jgi:glycosyltransferase involved in cell wall biosynthesis